MKLNPVRIVSCVLLLLACVIAIFDYSQQRPAILIGWLGVVFFWGFCAGIVAAAKPRLSALATSCIVWPLAAVPLALAICLDWHHEGIFWSWATWPASPILAYVGGFSLSIIWIACVESVLIALLVERSRSSVMGHSVRGYLLTGFCLISITSAVVADYHLRGLAGEFVTIDNRVAWTDSRVIGTPEPPPPFTTRPAFPGLRFASPRAFQFCAHLDTWFVAEESRIVCFKNRRNVSELEEVLTVPGEIYDFVLADDFDRTGNLYVTAGANPRKHVTRYKVSTEPPHLALADSRQEILSWSSPYAGGCLRFGPDGMLYVSIGDAASDDPSTYGSAQNLGTWQGSVLRIDVNHPADGKQYGIPVDNPFVGTEGVDPEIWAYGIRHIWRMNFDGKTGRLYGGDVGADSWEAIYHIERGKNYGWSYREGSHPYRTGKQPVAHSIEDPIAEHHHSVMRSITGGDVYHGSRLPGLRNRYLYGGYDTGTVWALGIDSGEAEPPVLIADTSLRISSFATDADKEIYLLDTVGGQIHELEKSATALHDVNDFPRRLSETGLFASVERQIPAPGVVSYSVNSPLWSDGAEKQRFLALPGRTTAEFEVVTYPQYQNLPGYNGWRFPNGTVLVKTFSLETESGNPQSKRPIETRILHLESLPGDNDFWRGYTYAWNDDFTDALLVESGGLDRTFQISDVDSPDGKREHTWRYPSRSDCTACHTQAAKTLLGVNTAQLNRTSFHHGAGENQLSVLERYGYLSARLPLHPRDLPALPDPNDETIPVAQRARSYLHANCAHCHQYFGGGNSRIDLRFHVPMEKTHLNEKPVHGMLGIPDARLVVPGDPERSILYQRMARRGPGGMPKVGTKIPDSDGLDLIYGWILAMPGKH